MSKIKSLYIDPRFDRVSEKELTLEGSVRDMVKGYLGSGLLRIYSDIALDLEDEPHVLLCNEQKQQQSEGPYFILVSERLTCHDEAGFLRIYGKALILGNFKETKQGAAFQNCTIPKSSMYRFISYKPMDLRKSKELEIKISQLRDNLGELEFTKDPALKCSTRVALETLYWALGKAEELPVIEKYNKAKNKIKVSVCTASRGK